MDKLEELASLIENRPFSIIADTNTFVWARAEHRAVFSEIKEIGGGNFLIVLGLFAVIGYLAKINAILNGRDVVTKTQKDHAKELLKPIFKEHPEIKDRVLVKRVGQINETDAFKQLMEDAHISWGMPQNDLFKVWDDLRNKLTHMVIPENGYQLNTRMGGENYKQAKEVADQSGMVFMKMADGRIHLFVDNFINKTDGLRFWLANEVRLGKHAEENIDIALSWLREN